jgi:ornithine--oxo-acid transaminase
VAIAALEVVRDEKLAENADALGRIFRKAMAAVVERHPIAKLIRGKGLLNALVINDSPQGQVAWNICLGLRDRGLLAKPTHGNIIRFAPPLVITEEQILDCVAIIDNTLADF